MSQPLYPPAGPLSIGRVLDLSFRIFQMSLVSCLLYGALSMIAGQLPNIYFIASGLPLGSFGGANKSIWLILYAIGMVIALTLSSALLLRQHGIATGQRTGTGVEISQALRRLPAYLGTILLAGLIFIIPTLVSTLIVGSIFGFASVFGGGTPGRNASVIWVMLLSLIPMIYFAAPMVFAPPAVILDNKSPWGAISYVVRLIRGSWWRITAVLTIAFVLIMVFYGVGMVIVGLLLPIVGMTDVASVSATVGVVYVVMGSLGFPFFSAVQLAGYGDLKVRREGLDLEQRVAGIVQS